MCARTPSAAGEPRRPSQPSAHGSFGTQLRLFRARVGLSQEALAERAGLGVATLGALERDQRQRPHPRTLATLAEALDLTRAERNALQQSALRREPATGEPSTWASRREQRWQQGQAVLSRRHRLRALGTSRRRALHNLPSGLST